jgi:predicted ATP-grasp superfamily ATP-dependent carboligase
VPVFVQASPVERELLSSRYLTGVVGLPLDPHADTATQVAHLNAAIAAVGVTCVAIAGDDESAVLVAEERAAIDPRLLTSNVPAALPRSLSDKVRLGELAAQAEVPYPRFIVSDDAAVLRHFAEAVGLPLVVKSPAPFARLDDPAVAATTIIHHSTDLQRWYSAATSGHQIFMQQYLAGPGKQTWYAAGVSANAGEWVPVWTGRKLVAHPPETGIGVLNVAIVREALVQHVRDLVRLVGYDGPFDTDWIIDPSEGTAHLIDFNPRRGAQFRLFQTTEGLDVVRATHMAMTGVPLPAIDQVPGIVHVVENLAVVHGVAALPWRHRPEEGRIEYSWIAGDDMAPARNMLSLMAGSATRKVRRRRAWPGS